MYFAEENERLRKIVRRIAEGNPEKITSRPIDALLYSVVRATNPERCLELGAFEGTTTLYIAQGLKDNEGGKLTSIEMNESNARGARQHLEDAEVDDYAEIIVGDSREIVPDLEGNFDLIFIDTSPNQYEEDYENATGLLAEGGILGIDDALEGNDELIERIEDEMNIITFEDWSFVLAQK
ncbi:MAG: class I SAM-dependent methyltransferase [Halobacteria archaeon]|nr:class I SAM-dependent methyltransferase [Halobacteria archaeon]